MSEDGDVDVESADDVPDIGVEATATTTNANGGIYEGETNDKRAHHNALERRRRDHIKDSFHGLRDCIPSLVGEKVSRAHILNKATEYIRHMQKGGSTREDDICDLARKNEILEEQVQALEDARTCGGPFSAEDLLHGVASRVQARQAQELVQQLQAKNSSKSSSKSAAKVQAPPTNPSPNTTTLISGTAAAGQSSATGSNAAADKKTAKSAVDTPTSASSALPSNINILASNIKNTQSLLSALQKNSNLPPNIKSLAARVFPLIRGATKTTQGKGSSAVPRGIVTATTVPKGSNLSSPSPASTSSTATPTATPLSKPSSSLSSATGTASAQIAELAIAESATVDPPIAEMVTVNTVETSTEIPLQSSQEVGVASHSQVTGAPESTAMPLPLDGVVSPSLLTSHILEAHNILQQQSGGSSGSGILDLVTQAGDLPDDCGGVVDPTTPPPDSSGISLPPGLNISPELLVQVSSFLNLPAASALSLPTNLDLVTLPGEDDTTSLIPQDTPQVPSQATPTPNPAPSSSNSLKRPSSAGNDPEVPAKRPHLLD